MRRWTWSLGRLIARTHAMFGFTIMAVVIVVMAGQVSFRNDFASTELYEDVMERWGAPIEQPQPSVRYVEHGAVFRELEAMPLARQEVAVDAEMNYRKRGLTYFSGFDFTFRGDYGVANPHDHAIDAVFVFPLSAERAQTLLSDLRFTVDGVDAPIQLREGDDKLIWTGRIEAGDEVDFSITYAGRGLESFRYALDPAMPVRGLDLTLHVTGGENFDYPTGVVPATEMAIGGDEVTLRWSYDALEAGVPMGAVLPSEKGFDDIITTMTVRAWAPFCLFFAGLISIGVLGGHRLRLYESALAVSAYAFFFVLLPYFAAFTNFYLAYALALALTAAPISLYLGAVIGPVAGRQAAMMMGATLLTPTLAVILQGYTGLIYTLEIFAALIALMIATTRPGWRVYLAGLRGLAAPAAAEA